MSKNKGGTAGRKSIAGVFIIALAVIVLAAGFFIYRGSTNEDKKGSYIDADTGNMTIPISELSSKATFYPYQAGDVKMEVLALKASDGTVRTAFNTCQVCYSSGRGYYKLDGTTLVCQNCGNRFSADQVEREKGGCNPVPITSEYKTESDGHIVINKDFLKQASAIFTNWKK